MILSGVPRIWASEGTSTQTICTNDQPCHTVVCSGNQPCEILKTPNSDFDFDTGTNIAQPLEGGSIRQPLEDADTIEMTPFLNADNSGYLEDQEDYLEDRQDMMEDAEYE
jgi:hypothetical protein